MPVLRWVNNNVTTWYHLPNIPQFLLLPRPPPLVSQSFVLSVVAVERPAGSSDAADRPPLPAREGGTDYASVDRHAERQSAADAAVGIKDDSQRCAARDLQVSVNVRRTVVRRRDVCLTHFVVAL